MVKKLKLWMRQGLGILSLVLIGIFFTVVNAVGTPVAVFPLQEYGGGRYDANIPLTRLLAQRLAESGNEIIDLKSVIAFMAINRIRSVGYLETYNIARVRDELGVPFVLLGTVTQREDRPEPSLGLTLQLVRTSDARTVWSFAGSLSRGEERRVLGFGEPGSTKALEPLLLGEVIQQWPWRLVQQQQPPSSINIETAILEPAYVKPGEEVHCTVRLRNLWRTGQAPRVFFKVEDQLYPATVSADGTTYKGSWVVGKADGRFTVRLLLSWPEYGRTEKSLLGTYVIDSASPVFKLELSGVKVVDGIPIFNEELVIKPQMLVRKPMSRWRLAFYKSDGDLFGDMTGSGNLPPIFVWQANNSRGTIVDNGVYEVRVEAWDKAGNMGSASRQVRLDRSAPFAKVSATVKGKEMIVKLNNLSRVPLASWQLQMWTKDGDLISRSDGKKLPVKIGVELTAPDQAKNIRGVVIMRDVFGHQSRQDVKDLLPQLKKKTVKKPEPKTISKNWVDEF